MKDVGRLYGHLVRFTDIPCILLPFGIFVVILVYFSRFGMLYQEKSGNPAPQLGMSFDEANFWNTFIHSVT
jgi:hypothetical protein